MQKLPKVNRKLAEKLLTSSGKQEGGVDGDNPLQDARFSNMFTNPDFEVDEESEAFQRLHPLISHRDKKLQGKKEANKPSVAEEEEVRRCMWSECTAVKPPQCCSKGCTQLRNAHTSEIL